ncbi:MAG: hypothetical protein NTU63_04125 [Candidatus Pacearchaeota archaeon]|nr:hypothetical protein [Candidatus Pacearchaeota archaeon]
MVNFIVSLITRHPLRVLGALILGITILILVLTAVILNRTGKSERTENRTPKYPSILKKTLA